VFAAAMAGRRCAAGWAGCQQWIRWGWQRREAEVVATLEGRPAEVGLPEEDKPATSPRRVVEQALTNLHDHQDKMHDDDRRQGLPIRSSHVESVVKPIHQRDAGTETCWWEAGSEAVGPLRASARSDGEALEAYWQRRPKAATRQPRYRRVG
jgi:hypothetical protein